MNRTRSKENTAPSDRRPLLWLAGAVLLALGGWFLVAQGRGDEHDHGAAASALPHRHDVPADLPHLHGLGYSADGSQLIAAAHSGLRLYMEGEWLVPDVPVNDYMGFSPVEGGFYSSGHPGPDSTRPNPLGLVKSVDLGRSLEHLGFEGESDFHLMAAGYRSHAIYLFNPQPNSRLEPGLHYTLDEGQSWQQAALQGLNSAPLALAVHPTEPGTIALGSEAGLLLSEDFGARFRLIGPPGPVTAVAFDHTGERLFFGYQQLGSVVLASGEVEAMPPLALGAEDAIAYIAPHPTAPGQLALATMGRDILVLDGQGAWRQIARAGVGQ